MKILHYKSLKIKKKYDKDIIDIFLKSFFFDKGNVTNFILVKKDISGFHKKTIDCKEYIVFHLIQIGFRKKLTSYLGQNLYCVLLKKKFRGTFFSSSKDVGASLVEDIFSEKYNYSSYWTQSYIFDPQFYLLGSTVGLIENNKKLKRQVKNTDIRNLFFPFYLNLYIFKMIL